MATCFENLVKHLQFAIRQLKQLKKGEYVDADEDVAYELLVKIEELYCSVF